jgi:hypothetical protein
MSKLLLVENYEQIVNYIFFYLLLFCPHILVLSFVAAAPAPAPALMRHDA